MTLPDSIRAAVQRAIDPSGQDRIRTARPLGGGCINETLRLKTVQGRSAFLKWNPSAPKDFFAAEAQGLETLRAAVSNNELSRLRVPEVLGLGSSASGRWLLLEMVEPGPAGPAFWQRLGKSLADLHTLPSPAHSWESNYIGPLAQDNAPTRSWPIFWLERRLEPQLRIAVDAGHFRDERGREFSKVLDRTEAILPDLETTDLALLHGDLWGGNVFADRSGRAVLVDPAVYMGDARVDLAMTELFGGFEPAFYDGYRQLLDPGPEYGEVLRHAYQLYPLLVHVNLFGGSYVADTLDRVRRILAY